MANFNRSHFTRGRPTYNCAVCERRTRDVDGAASHLCTHCYQMAGIENEVADGYTDPQQGEKEIAALKAECTKKGGKLPADAFNVWEVAPRFGPPAPKVEVK